MSPMMRPSLRLLLLVGSSVCVWLAIAASRSQAQSFDATNLRQPADLAGAWLVHGGDDPAYGRPDFDDSQWTRFDSHASLKDAFPNSRPNVVWYRLHVKVSPTQADLALAEYNLSLAFEVYVNGQLFLQNGRVEPFAPYTMGARLLKRIPDQQTATGSLLIAVRVHISRTEWDDSHPGFYASNLTLGQESALREHTWLTLIGQNAPSWIIDLAGLGLGIVALALFTAQRRQYEYLWIFLQFFSAACSLPLLLYESLYNVPADWELLRQPLFIASLFFQILMYFAFLRLRFGWWIRTVVAAAGLGLLLSVIGTAEGSMSRIASVFAMFPLVFLIAGVIPVLLVMHIRRGNREAAILLIPVALTSLTIYAQVVLFALGQIPACITTAESMNHFLFDLPVGPFVLSLNQLDNMLYILSLAVIMVLRSTRISRQQAMLEGEVAAAREVQQVILPEQTEAVHGFKVESIYQPAKQVGGDFFQVLPAGEGGLLVVVGDVAGKGLPAAMLVSVLVGVIRGVSEYTSEPAELLANLNNRLVGRAGGGFSTALAARMTADGQVTIANAGHLSPYLDGREMELPGALPLGIKADARYETNYFHLPPGSRLTFYSDGVVEAQNTKGELFGFERGRVMSTQPACNIVQAAMRFGQQDDITVVTIERSANRVSEEAVRAGAWAVPVGAQAPSP